MKSKRVRGFTLIELVLVIAILGILAVVALPTIFGQTLTAARANTAAMTAASVSAGLATYVGNEIAQGRPKSYPATLDSVANGSAASPTNVLFSAVLEQGVTSNWNKVSNTCYTYDANGSGASDAGDQYYSYTPATGKFDPVATCT
jgi:prepilin-type N-terminal cleavage/methylation domain-containing protein